MRTTKDCNICAVDRCGYAHVGISERTNIVASGPLRLIVTATCYRCNNNYETREMFFVETSRPENRGRSLDRSNGAFTLRDVQQPDDRRRRRTCALCIGGHRRFLCARSFIVSPLFRSHPVPRLAGHRRGSTLK